MLSVKMLFNTSVQAAPSGRKPRLPFFPCLSRVTRIHPSKCSPITCKPSYYSCFFPHSVVVTAQGAIALPACSPGCPIFVSVHLGGYLHKVLLLLVPFVPVTLYPFLSIQVHKLPGIPGGYGCPLHCSSWLLWYGHWAYPAYRSWLRINF